MPKSLAAFSSLLMLALASCQSKPLDAPPPTVGGGGHGDEQAENAGEGGASAEPATVITVFDEATISSDEQADNFQRVSSDVDFGAEPVARAALRVTLRSPCFPFAGWAEQPPPQGQNWPEPCDAFDRTLSVTLDEPARPNGEPALELVRAVTPFGGPFEVESDVTDVVNGLPGKHSITVRVDTWSDADGLVSGAKGEWLATAELRLWSGAAPRRVLAVQPLVLETQTEVDAGAVTFEVPEGAGSARLEYRATGHGGVGSFVPGCVGPAEEFCRRTHQLSLDGESLAELTPWRDDCETLCTMTDNDAPYGPASYCAENPCGHPDSVRAPRANWCPGSWTPPFVIDAAALTRAGTHELTRSIPGLAPGGQWRISLSYFAFE